ncbi:hypothetical protein V6N11_006083 [Hibiscus sabdariffa]|uniref:Peptidase M16 C-terminal domain-containing protein n=1 Tax=Hibiscus sabdariffa TaxID=183260 RepID=A0ABR2RQ65_9ROSI
MISAALVIWPSDVAPLDAPIDGISLPLPLPDYVAPVKQIKTLPNGLRIASEQLQTPAASVGKLRQSELQKIKAELEEVSNNPERFILEAVHSAGYCGPLANPLLASETAIERLDSGILEEFVSENSKGNRIVLAASGIENEELLRIAEPLLSDLPAGPQPKEPKSLYVGGNFRRRADSPSTHFALAFEVPGGWNNEKDSVTLIVMQSSDFVSKAVDIAAEELLLLATEGSVSRLMMKRAQEATKSTVLMNLESRMVDEVTLQDITNMAKEIVYSPLTMASFGVG